MILYHGTDYRSALQILRDGFVGGSFTPKYDEARAWARFKAVDEHLGGAVLKVSLPRKGLTYSQEEFEYYYADDRTVPGHLFKIVERIPCWGGD